MTGWPRPIASTLCCLTEVRAQPALRLLGVGLRYGLNLMARVAEQENAVAAVKVGCGYFAGELRKLPRLLPILVGTSSGPGLYHDAPAMSSPEIDAAVGKLGVAVRDYVIDVHAFWRHVAAIRYPRFYAAGTMSKGGAREQKLLEYFVSLDLLRLSRDDVVIDIASEWSVFPRVVRALAGARVYRQDLVYPPGVHGDRIGGNASRMLLPDGFADKLVLHNAYEHFEGTADTDFIREAWRVLRPGGMVCILPLNVTDRYSILTDPLVDRRGIVWDSGARVVEVPTWHNRFGRFYDACALTRRVIEPARRIGFDVAILRVQNTQAVHPSTYLHFGLLLTKPTVAAAPARPT